MVNSNRHANGKKNKRLPFAYKVDPEYKWAVNGQSPHLQVFLDKVPAGIRASAAKYSVTIDPNDDEYLTANSGRYERYLHPKSKGARRAMRTKRGKLLVEQGGTVFEDDYLLRKKVHILASPRLANASGGAADKGQTDSLYETNLQLYWNFLAIRGCYDDMLLLLPHPHKNTPSMSSSNLRIYTYFRTQKRFSPLREFWNQGSMVRDLDGHHMTAEGGLQNYIAADHYQAAISSVHIKWGKTGDYQEQCLRCVEKKKEQKDKLVAALNTEGARNEALALALFSNNATCNGHASGNPPYTNTGNPAHDGQITKLCGWLKKRTKELGYTPDHRSPILPYDLVCIQAHLRREDFNIYHLRNFVVILNSIDLGLRFDTYSEVKADDFNVTNAHWLIQRDLIGGFHQQVMGKADQTPVTYMHSFCDSHPTRCFPRHFLVYIHCTNIQSGYLFPPREQLMEAVQAVSTGGDPYHATIPTTEQELMRALTYLKERELPASEHMNLGLHSPVCRSTCTTCWATAT